MDVLRYVTRCVRAILHTLEHNMRETCAVHMQPAIKCTLPVWLSLNRCGAYALVVDGWCGSILLHVTKLLVVHNGHLDTRITLHTHVTGTQ